MEEKDVTKLLFEIYQKGVNNEDCDLTEYYKQLKDLLKK
jgi:hypothetical protein